MFECKRKHHMWNRYSFTFIVNILFALVITITFFLLGLFDSVNLNIAASIIPLILFNLYHWWMFVLFWPTTDLIESIEIKAIELAQLENNNSIKILGISRVLDVDVDDVDVDICQDIEYKNKESNVYAVDTKQLENPFTEGTD